MKLEAGGDINAVSSSTASVIIEGALAGVGSTVDLDAGNEITLDNSAGGGDILITDNFGSGTVNLTFVTCNPVGACSGPIINAGTTNTTVLPPPAVGAVAAATNTTLLELLSGATGEGLVFPIIGDVLGDIVIDTSNLGLDDITNQILSLITTETLASEEDGQETLDDEEDGVRSRGQLCY